MSQTKTKNLQDPTEELKTLHDQGTQEVNLHIKRQLPGGKWQSLGGDFHSATFTVTDILEGAVEKFIEDKGAGGGDYVIAVRDVNNLTHTYFRWRLNLPGTPLNPNASVKDPTPSRSGGGGGQQGPVRVAYEDVHGVRVPRVARDLGLPTPRLRDGRHLTPPPQHMLPKWATTLPVAQQWDIFYEEQKKDGKLSEEGLAAHYAGLHDQRNQQLLADRERLQERVLHLERQASEREQALREELAKLERERAEERHRSELRALEARMEALAHREPPKPAFDAQGIAAVASAFAPVIAAFVSSRQTQVSTEKELQLSREKMERESQAQTLALLTKKDNNLDWAKLFGVATPLLVKMLDRPQEMAAMKSEQSVMLMQMLMESISAQAESAGQEHWVLPVIRNFMESLPELAGGFMQARAQAQAARGLPAGSETPAALTQGPGALLTDGIFEQFAQRGEEEALASREVQMIYQIIPPSYGFHTHEWRMLLLNLHARTAPNQIAPAIGRHLIHALEFGTVPAALARVLEDPEGALTPVFQDLPINKRDPAYVNAVLGHLCQWIRTVQQQMEAEGPDDAPVAAAKPDPNLEVMGRTRPAIVHLEAEDDVEAEADYDDSDEGYEDEGDAGVEEPPGPFARGLDAKPQPQPME